jgi:hypothetical protein
MNFDVILVSPDHIPNSNGLFVTTVAAKTAFFLPHQGRLIYLVFLYDPTPRADQSKTTYRVKAKLQMASGGYRLVSEVDGNGGSECQEMN